jgi:hypothetical protein
MFYECFQLSSLFQTIRGLRQPPSPQVEDVDPADNVCVVKLSIVGRFVTLAH